MTIAKYVLPDPTKLTKVKDGTGLYLSRFGLWWAGALACLAALYVGCLGWGEVQPGFGDGPSIYIVSGLSLAHGTGYRLINYPDLPPALLYPIGYPLLLSAVLHFVPFGATSIFLMRMLNVVGALVWVEGSRRVLRRMMSPVLAAAGALAIGTMPLLIEMNGQVKADVIFGAVLVWTIVLAGGNSKAETAQGRISRGIGIGLLAACAMLLRTIGFTLVFGVAAEMIWKRRWNQLVGYLAGAGVVLGIWMIGGSSHHGSTFQAYTSENLITWRTPLAHLWLLSSNTAPAMAFPLLGTPQWNAIAERLHLQGFEVVGGFVITALVVLGWVGLLRKSHVISLVLGPYMLVVFLWWFEPTRFVVPVLPLLLCCAAEGARMALREVKIPVYEVSMGLLVLCIAGGLIEDGVRLARVWRYGDLNGAQAAEDWGQIEQGLGWIDAHTSPDAVVFTSYPSGVYLFTARQTLDLNNVSHTSAVYVPTGKMDLEAQFSKADAFASAYVFATYRWDYTEKMEWGISPVERYRASHPGKLEPMWESGDGKVRIFKVNGERGDTASHSASLAASKLAGYTEAGLTGAR
jgi:hypothetical protein